MKQAVSEVQRSFSGLDWVVPTPQHFLHVAAPTSASEWSAVDPFTLTYRRVNCFHDAAIVEAHSEAGAPFPPAPFLPHLSIGYFRRAEKPDALRDALAQHRDVELGSALVEEIVVCDVPVGTSRLFEPWHVVERIRLGR